MTSNPYQAPESRIVQDVGLPEARYRHLAMGQKFIIYSIAMYFAISLLAGSLGSVWAWLIVFPLLLGIVGIVRALIGLENHIMIKIIYFIMMFIPLLNILALARINAKIIDTLKKAGYQVGFFGVVDSSDN